MDCHISILFPPEKLLHQIIMWTIFYRENLNQQWCVQDLMGESINRDWYPTPGAINGDWYPTPERRCLCMMGLPNIQQQQHRTGAPRTFRTLSRKTCGLAIRLILIALRTFGVYCTARLTKTPAPRLWRSYVCSRPGGPYLHNTSLLSYTLCPREFTML